MEDYYENTRINNKLKDVASMRGEITKITYKNNYLIRFEIQQRLKD